MLKKKLGKLLENISTIDTIESLSIIQKTQPKPSDPSKSSDTIPAEQLQWNTDNTKPKVAESENIGANHLKFAKSLFQHYCQYLGLNHNHISTESAFNFYVNEKISSLLGTPMNTELARETLYKELIQNTNLLTNHNFASIITEINKEIEHYTQQRYPITYASKDKRKLQTLAKKNRVEFPSNLSYHYTPGSAINISSTDAFSSTQQLENLEIKTPNIQTPPNQRNQKPELINQQNLSPVIVIDQPPINPIAKPIQQPLQLPSQQPEQQQPLQQPPQLPNLDPMAYTPITKLDNFTGEEDDAQIWLNDSLVNKPQDFNAFKVEFLRYFSNNNSINRLVNTFTTMKQEKTEAILNQFIRGLCSSILQHIRPLHPGTLQDAVTCARDFESAESEANHAQAINLVMNGLSELDSKLEKFSESINKRLEEYLADNHTIYQSSQQRNNQGHPNYGQNQPRPSSLTNQQWQQETCICHYCGNQGHIQIDCHQRLNNQ
ncbi:hypothetical protein G9A89_019751 [Geosiphon pyriformis]|nr:hypothetical protein G9A89_019751 [Geosiphon pyriformis]